jgi:hypothetical protein
MRVVRAQIQTVEEIRGDKSRSKPTTRARIDCFVRTDWNVIGKDGFAHSATNMAATAGANSSRWARLQIGGVLRWRNSAE